MNVIPLMENIKQESFIKDYLVACQAEDIEEYIKPIVSKFQDPSVYVNMGVATEVFLRAALNHKKFGILVDSDVDGSCSATIIKLFLRETFGIEPTMFYHTGKQHGISTDQEEDIVKQVLDNNIELFVIPDAGSNDVEECKELKEKNVQTIILDHHEVLVDNEYAIVVNNQIGEKANKNLSGSGVAYQFVRSVCAENLSSVPNYIDLVAISLISDMCDLRNIENRSFISIGFNYPKNEFVKYLFEKCCAKRGVTPEGIGWDISPLGNCLARMNEQDKKSLFVDALCGDVEPEIALKSLRSVKRLQDNIVKNVTNKISETIDYDKKAIIGFADNKDKELVGVIANKFCGKYRKPTFIIRELNSTTYSGSMRSPVELLDKINESGLAKAQGHQSACGVYIPKENFVKFQEWLEEFDLSAKPDIPVTAIVDSDTFTIDFCDQINSNRIFFGQNIPKPTFYIKKKISKENVFVYKKNTTTIKIIIDGVSFIKFFASDEEVNELTKHEEFEIELVVTDCSVNEFNGTHTPQCLISDFEVCKIANKEEEFSWEGIFN